MKNMRSMGENRKKAPVMKILIGIIIVLVLVIAYFFVINPGINSFVYNKQVEAANVVSNNIYADMVTQLQNTGAYQLQVGNQTLILVPYTPPQEA